MRRNLVLVVLAVAASALTACLPTPGRHPGTATPRVIVFGDSVTPNEDYRIQAVRSGYDLTNQAAAASGLCGGRSGSPIWPQIHDAITSQRYDFVVLQYNASENYQSRCGGAPAAYPFDPNDPGRGWRLYLEAFASAAKATGDRTHIIVLGTPGGKQGHAFGHSFYDSMNILDAGSRAMAARLPRQLTFVDARGQFAPNGNWRQHVPCLQQEKSGRCGKQVDPTWPDGHVRVRPDDTIHLYCPGRSSPVSGRCLVSSPGGLRYRFLLFNAMNAHLEARTGT